MYLIHLFLFNFAFIKMIVDKTKILAIYDAQMHISDQHLLKQIQPAKTLNIIKDRIFPVAGFFNTSQWFTKGTFSKLQIRKSMAGKSWLKIRHKKSLQ